MRDEMTRGRRRCSGRLTLVGILSISLLIGLGIGLGLFFVTRGPALVETPRLTGVEYRTASGTTTAVGLTLRVDPNQRFPNSKDLSTKKITSQSPEAGSSVKKGNTITVQLEADKPVKPKHVVCLDPGHSSGGPSTVIDSESGLDVADSQGADGEIPTNWDIAQKTKVLLEQAGYEVRLTRQSLDAAADLRQRSDIGNTCDIMIRIHYDPGVHAILYPGAGQTKSHGSSTLTVSSEISEKSRVLANALLPYLQPLGVTRVDNDMGGSSNNTGGAYVGSVLSKVPVVVIEDDPDVVRNNPTGQDLVASAITNGVKAYFNTK
jgi:N-acetylmuramoyl-L-alanine amidase